MSKLLTHREYVIISSSTQISISDDCGDAVICINTSEIALPGDEWVKKAYFHHTGYPGGATWTLAHELHRKDKTMIMRKSVYRAVGRNLQRRHTMQRLHLFANAEVPENLLGNVTNQIKQLRPVPERLDHISEEVRKNFPKIMRHPLDFVPKKEL